MMCFINRSINIWCLGSLSFSITQILHNTSQTRVFFVSSSAPVFQLSNSLVYNKEGFCGASSTCMVCIIWYIKGFLNYCCNLYWEGLSANLEKEKRFKTEDRSGVWQAVSCSLRRVWNWQKAPTPPCLASFLQKGSNAYLKEEIWS